MKRMERGKCIYLMRQHTAPAKSPGPKPGAVKTLALRMSTSTDAHLGFGGTKHRWHVVLPEESVTTSTGSPRVWMCAVTTPAIGRTAA